MTKYNKQIGDSFGCDWPEILWKNRAKELSGRAPIKECLSQVNIFSYVAFFFLVPTKSIFKN